MCSAPRTGEMLQHPPTKKEEQKVLLQQCHPTAGLDVRYDNGVIQHACHQCKRLIGVFRIS